MRLYTAFLCCASRFPRGKKKPKAGRAASKSRRLPLAPAPAATAEPVNLNSEVIYFAITAPKQNPKVQPRDKAGRFRGSNAGLEI